ncbi:MAG TPA: dTMP kinase [Syntrophales bacterium]|nr:dTMP kinase [Syntrophales bacterium]HOM07329.1 dTMP kinase [Syntrophales bacterium]HOO00704.1 dTMP kinase [Syntrophales bacterium]HPC01290.1 dTMP kinase [Syntrophales bacterium]HPQ06826.1 dTMP kinase [Syntrophales bacterium]
MGLFITFEGIEGCGKTTQVDLAAERLRRRSLPVLVTREPGGTDLGTAVRALLLNRGERPPDAVAELFLFAAARAQHCREVIGPALAAGTIVLCDRFADATVAYQAYGRGLPLETVRFVNDLSTGPLRPDRTFLFDLEPKAGLSRALTRIAHRGGGPAEDRFEGEDLAFHEAVRRGYLEEARRDPGRFRVIPAEGTVEEVAAAVGREMEDLLRERGYVL